MGFAKETKKQILKNTLTNDCCGLAFLSGLINASGKFKFQNKKIRKITITTEISNAFEFCKKISIQLYGIAPTCSMFDSNNSNIKKTKKTYHIIFTQDLASAMLSDIGLVDETKNFKVRQIDDHLVKDACCKKSYIKGVFVGSATSGINFNNEEDLSKNKADLKKISNARNRSGYDIEFISNSHDFLLQFSNLLAEFNIFPRLIKRKNHYVLYLKESAAVSDLLALVEAYDSVLQLQNELAVRELRNKINRQTNCLNANISKTVDASLKQIEALDNIASSIGIDALPPELQSVALLRIANPEESLSELLKLSTEKITRNTLNYRLNKIIKIAKDL
ncbi:MAG: DNA-binding protein WhiA [Clostridia bacterium]|jgi:hypothetical protein|nr:DNA-binding protein WhiA [Clostridia bacterium]MDD3232026.1 DNA-binding protein WhiA [Clostridia bacterium]MDD4408275.1 DNA-binding protein WhiA [Clostridia bacterium]